MNEKGQTLIEVVIGMVLLGLVATSFFVALNISIKATNIVNLRTTAESLTRAELEYLKNCDYVSWQYTGGTSTPPDYGDPNERIPDIFSDHYTMTLTAVPIHPITHEPLFDIETGEPLFYPPMQDQGIQEITLSVYFHDELVLTTESYKIDR